FQLGAEHLVQMVEPDQNAVEAALVGGRLVCDCGGELRPWAHDRRTWDHVRFVLLNPERLTIGNTPTKYLLTGLIFCGVCGGRMLSRPRDNHTKRYVCAGRRIGHQLAILAQ